MKFPPFAAVLLASFPWCGVAGSSKAAEPPPDRVVVMYFHRTERCPTCKKMGSYAEEAIKQGFGQQREQGRVEFHYIDFQLPANESLATGYRVTGPALVVAKIDDGKVADYVDLDEIWMKVREKPTFLSYVQEQVRHYLDE